MSDSSVLAACVRDALGATYERPIVVDHGDRVAVLDGRPLALARAAVTEAMGPDGAARVEALDIANLAWHAVPADGLRLWRQHARSGADGELVTEVEAGDPPLQVVTVDDGWALVRLLDGAQGWVAAQDVADSAAVPEPNPKTLDVGRVDLDAFVAAATELLDVPYVWGGTTRTGVDCSGIVQRCAWRAGGCWLPRHSRALLRVGARVSPAAVRRGDVLILQRDPSTIEAERQAQLAALAREEARTGRVPAHGPAVHPMHVAIACSADTVLHASRDAMRVVTEPLAGLRERYRVLGVRRLGPAA